MPRKTAKQRPGVGAKLRCRARFVSPGKEVKGHEKYQNNYDRAWLEGGNILERRMHQVKRGRTVMAYRFWHDDFDEPGTFLWVAVRNCTITEEGPPEGLFDTDPPAGQGDQGDQGDQADRSSRTNSVLLPTGADGVVIGRGATREDISALRAEGITVDSLLTIGMNFFVALIKKTCQFYALCGGDACFKKPDHASWSRIIHAYRDRNAMKTYL